MSEYVMEGNNEAERMERKTDMAAAIDQLSTTGLTAGMNALDVGCAAGVVTRCMATLTDPTRVTGVDISEERLIWARGRAAELGLPLTFVQGNGVTLPFENGQFDYAWSRFVFEYQQDPLQMLSEMIRVVRPGGKVVVGDLDGNCIYHYPLSPSLESQMKQIMDAAAKTGFDPYVGRKLYTWFYQAGLKDIKVRLIPYHCFAGRIPESDQFNWFTKLEVLVPVGERALGSAEAYADFAAEMKDFLLREDTFTYSTLILVEGTVG